jgi:hypothetical protein
MEQSISDAKLGGGLRDLKADLTDVRKIITIQSGEMPML